MADVSVGTGAQEIVSGNLNNAAALTIILPGLVAGYGLYKKSYGAPKSRNPSLANVLEDFIVPLGFGWTAGYIAARYGGLNNAMVVGLIAGGGVFVYNYVLMADVDSYIKKDL